MEFTGENIKIIPWKDSILDTVRDRPGMFVGVKSLTALWFFLHGYEMALWRLGHEDQPEVPKHFSDWVGYRLHLESNRSGFWYHAILERIRDVSTQIVMTPIKWTQPDGLSLIMPVGCNDCEYDFEGNRILSGQEQPDGTFFGENIEIVRDDHGHVIERTRINATDGKVIEQEKDGPFGSVGNLFQWAHRALHEDLR